MARAPDKTLQSCCGDVEIQKNGVCHLTKLWETDVADQAHSSVGHFGGSFQLLVDTEVQEWGGPFDGKWKRLM